MNARLLYQSPAAVIPFERQYTLARNIPAIQIVSSEPGDHSRLGLMTQLPEGTDLRVDGSGFNERTVRVRCQGTAYFVFYEDLEPQRKPAAFAAFS